MILTRFSEQIGLALEYQSHIYSALIMLMKYADSHVPLLYCTVPYRMWLLDDSNLKCES